MYDIANKNTGTFGIAGYKVPKEYQDARQLKYVREGMKPKNAPRATKKGDYISEAVKLSSGIPGPNSYNVVKPWVGEPKKQAPGKVPHRHTFLEEISIEGKRRPQPGPGAYDVLKAGKEKANSVKPRA